MEIGVASLKIEGRLKSPEYVANVTRHYRRAIDAAWNGSPAEFSPRDVRELELSFSRGFSHGFLDGTDYKLLVRGDYAKKRGIFLGHVTAVTASGIRLNLAAPVKNGDGLVLDGDEANGVPEQGGRIYEALRPGRTGSEELSSGPAEIRFPDVATSISARFVEGQPSWKTGQTRELTRRIRATFQGNPHRLVPLDIHVVAEAGRVLSVEGRTETERFTLGVEAADPPPVAERLKMTTEADIREQMTQGLAVRSSSFEV